MYDNSSKHLALELIAKPRQAPQSLQQCDILFTIILSPITRFEDIRRLSTRKTRLHRVTLEKGSSTIVSHDQNCAQVQMPSK